MRAPRAARQRVRRARAKHVAGAAAEREHVARAAEARARVAGAVAERARGAGAVAESARGKFRRQRKPIMASALALATARVPAVSAGWKILRFSNAWA